MAPAPRKRYQVVSVAIARGRKRCLPFLRWVRLVGGTARQPEGVGHQEKVRGLRLDEGYHILGLLRLQVGVGIVIESILGKPLH